MHIERKKTILIVDDNEDARFVLSAILNYDGYRVLLAENGAQGVEQARAELPDLVLMDLRMPIMDGFEAAELLVSGEATRHIPIIAVSAEEMHGRLRERGHGLFAACLMKPLAAATLESHVRGIIGNP